MTLTEEQKRKDFRAVFELLDRKPRIKYTEIARILDVDIRIASSRLKDAIEKEYIVGPQIRKKSFSNLKNYVNFVDCDDPAELYLRCAKDKNVVYHAILDGFCNFQVISESPMNIKGSVLKGALPDYFISRPPDLSWEMTIDTMRDMIAKFNPEDYIPKNYITNHWNETVEWSKEFEILYRELKYNLRRPLMHIVNSHNMWRGKAYDFLEQLPEYCIIFTCYYQESLSTYDECLYAFETDYEDFVIDVFSQLPTTSWFYKVEDRLIAHLQIKTKPSRKRVLQTKDVTGVQILLLIKDMMKKGIVKNEAHSTFKCYWRKEASDI
ncbi:MAG: winged helix-turn-helix domain-containing protein [Theionarchaea archaeon]|nr:winged helix-turn-helix domain-containing protein [Theionarchaea archaeon]